MPALAAWPQVWDFARCQTEQTCAGHGGDVKCVGWHPFKSLLVSASKDGLVKLWCPKSGRALGTMHGHKGTIMAAQWNANGNWVLTASRDQTCKVGGGCVGVWGMGGGRRGWPAGPYACLAGRAGSHVTGALLGTERLYELLLCERLALCISERPLTCSRMDVITKGRAR